MDLNRLAKVWRLTASPNAGEAAAARDRVRVIVEKAGKTLADVPQLLRGHPAGAPPEPGPGGFAFCDPSNPAHAAAFAAAERKRRAERARREAPERAEVLERYGGLGAVLAPTGTERLLRAAVAPWSVFGGPPHGRRVRSVDGYGCGTIGPPPARVADALSAAVPLPATVAAAAAERAMWEARDRDLGLALEDTGESHLDLPARIRRDIVTALLETGLRARSVAEVLIRQRHLVSLEYADAAIERAVLLDLESLAAGERPGQGKPAPARSPRTGAPTQAGLFD